MLYGVTIIFLGILDNARAAGPPYDDEGVLECPGNKQIIEVPLGYDKEVPENIDGDYKSTMVQLMFIISQLKTVQEDRWADLFDLTDF